MTPLDRCPYAPAKARGAHNLAAVIPPDTDHDLILFCDRCGATRRIPIERPAPLDDMDAADIIRTVRAG